MKYYFLEINSKIKSGFLISLFCLFQKHLIIISTILIGKAIILDECSELIKRIHRYTYSFSPEAGK